SIVRDVFVTGGVTGWLIEGADVLITFEDCGFDADQVLTVDGWVFQQSRSPANPAAPFPPGSAEILMTGCKQEHHGANLTTGDIARAWHFLNEHKVTMIAPSAESPGGLASAHVASALVWEG